MQQREKRNVECCFLLLLFLRRAIFSATCCIITVLCGSNSHLSSRGLPSARPGAACAPTTAAPSANNRPRTLREAKFSHRFFSFLSSVFVQPLHFLFFLSLSLSSSCATPTG